MIKRAYVLNVLLLGLAGCAQLFPGHAEMVRRDKNGGVLALKDNRDKAMADAKRQMADNCPDGYEITGEEMAKVGEKTEGAEDTHYHKKGADKTSETITSDVKEYRITYECKHGSEAPAADEATSGGEQPD